MACLIRPYRGRALYKMYFAKIGIFVGLVQVDVRELLALVGVHVGVILVHVCLYRRVRDSLAQVDVGAHLGPCHTTGNRNTM